MENIMHDTLMYYLKKEIPFKISLINNDNWNKPLPDNIKIENFLNIEMKETYIKDVEIDNNNIKFKIKINNNTYEKTIKPEEILALITLENIPIIFNHFLTIKD